MTAGLDGIAPRSIARSSAAHPAAPRSSAAAIAWRAEVASGVQLARTATSALLAATGAPVDPFPPALADLARRYFELYPPEGKA